MKTKKQITRYENGVFTVEKFLSKEECKVMIEKCDQQTYHKATINTVYGMQVMQNVRNNDRVMFDDFELASEYFERMREDLPQEINLWKPYSVNERFRFLRYGIEEFYNWHKDGSFMRDHSEGSRLTLLIYLNDDFEGGETEFEDMKVSPKKGMAVIFPHPLRHCGCSVIIGTKYVLRTDIMYKAPGLQG